MLSSAARFGIVHSASGRKKSSSGGEAPVSVTSPVVSPASLMAGTAPVEATNGVWTGTGITYTYQWYNNLDDAPLAGQTNSSISAADTNFYLFTTVYVVVTATNGAGSVSARSSNTCFIFIDA